MSDYSQSLKACGYRGRPAKNNTERYFTPEECAQMGGKYAPPGECLIVDNSAPGGVNGSYSWNCASLNDDPTAIAFGYRWHAGAALIAAAGLWLYAKRR